LGSVVPVGPEVPAKQVVESEFVSWTPTVQSEFDRLLVHDLAERGAASIDELQERGFGFDGVALTGCDLVSLVESARRRGLVEPLGHSTRASGEEVKATEWAATDRGRNLAPPGRALWMGRRRALMHSVRKMWPFLAIFLALVPLSSLGGAFGDDPSTKLDVAVGVVAVQAFLIVFAVMFLDEHARRRAVRVAYEWPGYEAAGKPLPPEWAEKGDVPKELRDATVGGVAQTRQQEAGSEERDGA
jgi:hypothetical protein